MKINGKMIRIYAVLSQAVFLKLFFIFIGFKVGKWIDDSFNSKNIFSIIGVVVGFLAGFYNLIRTVRNLER